MYMMQYSLSHMQAMKIQIDLPIHATRSEPSCPTKDTKDTIEYINIEIRLCMCSAKTCVWPYA